MKKLLKIVFGLLAVLLVFLFLVGKSTEKTVQESEKKIDEKPKITVTKAEVDNTLKSLSKNLEVKYDDMKEITYYSCRTNSNIYPQIFLIPYIVVDKDHNFSLKNHILCVSNRNYEILYFNTLYIKSAKGVAHFSVDEKDIVRSYAGEEYIDDMNPLVYEKLLEAVESDNIKIRLEGRLYAERDLTPEEISQIRSVLSIYQYISNVEILP